MPPETDPNVQTTTTNEDPKPSNTNGSDGQKGVEAKYAELLGAISAGEYVAKNVYVGLQQKHEAEVNAKKQMAADLANAKSALEAAQAQVSQLSTEKLNAETGLKEASTKLERQKLVMNDFPDLAKWEAEGLLPDAPLDKLPELLKSISARVKDTKAQAKTEAIAGASPLGSSSQELSTTDKAKQKLNEANAALIKGDTGTYEKLMAEYQVLKKDLPK